MSNTINRQITFTQVLLDRAQARARQLGVSFTEYVRGLIVQDSKRFVDDNIPFVDERTEESIKESLKDYKSGNYVVLKTGKEIDEFFDRLDNE